MAQPGVGWVYKLKKDELVKELIKYGIEESGSVPDLRKRLIKFVRSNPAWFETKPKDEANYNEIQDTTIDEERNAQELVYFIRKENASSPKTVINMEDEEDKHINMAVNKDIDIAKTIDQIRKWNCHFDGRDIYAFLERVEELKIAYEFTDNQMLKGLPEMLKGEAILWHRNEARNFSSWQELIIGLKNYFVSPEEKWNLNRQIRERKQKPNESIRSFVTALSTLMRRSGEISRQEQLDNLYYNMRSELRLYITRESIISATDIVQKVERIEETLKTIKQENKRIEGKFHNSNIAAFEAPYDGKNCCWKCKKRGHNRTECKGKLKKFCSYCGTDNVWTRDCNCHTSGNGSRADSGREQSRPIRNQ